MLTYLNLLVYCSRDSENTDLRACTLFDHNLQWAHEGVCKEKIGTCPSDLLIMKIVSTGHAVLLMTLLLVHI